MLRRLAHALRPIGADLAAGAAVGAAIFAGAVLVDVIHRARQLARSSNGPESVFTVDEWSRIRRNAWVHGHADRPWDDVDELDGAGLWQFGVNDVDDVANALVALALFGILLGDVDPLDHLDDLDDLDDVDDVDDVDAPPVGPMPEWIADELAADIASGRPLGRLLHPAGRRGCQPGCWHEHRLVEHPAGPAVDDLSWTACGGRNPKELPADVDDVDDPRPEVGRPVVADPSPFAVSWTPVWVPTPSGRVKVCVTHLRDRTIVATAPDGVVLLSDHTGSEVERRGWGDIAWAERAVATMFRAGPAAQRLPVDVALAQPDLFDVALGSLAVLLDVDEAALGAWRTDGGR